MAECVNDGRASPSPNSSETIVVSHSKAESTAGFPHFRKLPPELQGQIWREALPGDIKRAALFTWRPGCWGPAFRVETDPDYRTPIDEHDRNLILKFNHDRLGYTRIYVPMAAVCAEAYDIAVAWAAEQGVEIHKGVEGDGPMFVRPFHPERDVLYVSPRDWDEFISEPMKMPFELDIFKDQFYGHRSAMSRVAVSELSLGKESILLELDLAHQAVRYLYVVADPQPDERSRSGVTSVPWRLEIEHAQAWKLFWVSDHQGIRRRDSFVRGFQRPHGLEGGLWRRVAEVSRKMHEDFIQHVQIPSPGRVFNSSFEVRIVHIVKVG